MYKVNNIISKAESKNKHLVEEVAPAIEAATSSSAPGPERHATEVDGADVLVIDNFLSAEECAALVRAGDQIGFSFWADQPQEADEAAPRSNPHCREACDKDDARAFRTAHTIEAEFPALSHALWRRLQPIMAAHGRSRRRYAADMPDAETLFERDIAGEWEAEGFCPNLLLARYGPGGHFAPHADGSTVSGLNRRSLYTTLIYLNTVPHGGGTHVYGCDQCEVLVTDPVTGRVSGSGKNVLHTVRPVAGRLAVFYHAAVHEGVAVGADGCKYIIRGDLMYNRTPPIGDANDLEAFDLYTKARELESNGEAMEAVKLFMAVKRKSRLLADIYQL